MQPVVELRQVSLLGLDTLREACEAYAKDWYVAWTWLLGQRFLPFFLVFTGSRPIERSNGFGDFVVEVILECAIRTVGIPFVNDHIDLVFDVLGTYVILC